VLPHPSNACFVFAPEKSLGNWVRRDELAMLIQLGVVGKSALGQKQTYAPREPCPLCPRKPTCAVSVDRLSA